MKPENANKQPHLRKMKVLCIKVSQWQNFNGRHGDNLRIKLKVVWPLTACTTFGPR